MLGALTVHGLIPGPALFQQQGDFVTALLIGMLMVTCLHFVVAMVGMPLFIRAVRIPRGVLFPIVIVLCVTGTLVSTSSTFDVFVMLGFGFLGYLMTRFGYPIAPMLIGFILGPLVEMSLRQAMYMSENSVMVFFERPVSAVFMALTGLAVASVIWQAVSKRKKET
jgi:putative tricarboxylic transport membrane protein